MPFLLQTAAVILAGSFLLVAVRALSPASGSRARWLSGLLIIGAGGAFVSALALIEVGVLETAPVARAFFPAAAIAVAAVSVWALLSRVADIPDDGEEAESEPGEDDGGGGGGGGLRPPDRDGPPPGPGGIAWDAFDRERQAWERERDPARV